MSLLKKSIPTIISIVVFLLISCFYFSTILGKEKALKQNDITQWNGAFSEIAKYRELGENALWTNSMFSGMPAYQIGIDRNNKYTIGFVSTLIHLGLPYPISQLFILFLGFFVLLRSFKVDNWVALIGALAFGLCSNNFIFIAAGHQTKVEAIALSTFIIAGINFILRGNKPIGILVATVGGILEFEANHLQITYYIFLLIGLWLFVEFIFAIKNKYLKQFGFNILLIGIPIIIAVGLNITNLLVTQEYTPYTNRGPSEITINKTTEEIANKGIDKDYALDYSYSVSEPLTILIPNLYGGEKNYWGSMPISAGPPYFGAIVFFLFILGFFVLKGKERIWLVAATIFSIVLSMGKNAGWITDLFFDHFPMYNKFRAVTLLLSVAQITIPIMAFLALQAVVRQRENKAVTKFLLYATGITGLICLFFIFNPDYTIDFDSYIKKLEPYKDRYANEIATLKDPQQQTLIAADWGKAVAEDAQRSLIFVILAAGTLFVLLKTKLNSNIFIAILGVLIFLDMYLVDQRYLSNKNFENKKKKTELRKSVADISILKDTDPHYRVLNLSVSTFNDATTSVFHKSVGGYHGAKLRRYQELYENHLASELDYLRRAFSTLSSPDQLSLYTLNTGVLNMLNTKYIIANSDREALKNDNALGNAWFVNEVKRVINPDSELVSLNSLNTRTTCAIDESKFKAQLDQLKPSLDSTARISLISYDPNELNYKYIASTPQVVVFSEIYYDKGWKAFIDDQPADYFRCNFVLRGMGVPSGVHTIKFKFDPASFKTGEIISIIFQIIFGLLVIGIVLYEYRESKKTNALN